MNAQRYIDLLKEHIIPSIEEIYMDKDYIYQDDWNSIHRVTITLNFIEENMPSRIRPEDQASKLDDVWPIENVWSIIEMELLIKDFSNLNQVKTEIKQIWKIFDVNLCTKMMLSVPRSLKALIKYEGRRIVKSDY